MLLLILSALSLAPRPVRAWVPTGAPNINASPECRDEVLTQELFKALAKRTSGEKWDKKEWGEVEKMIQRYMDRCADQLYKGSFSKIIDYLQLTTVGYDYKKSGDIREVSFRFPGDGYTTRAILALKRSKTPRPLIIYKCGLSCDLGESSMLYTLMVFFDMGPFNVLMIPSNSAPSFIKENHVFAVGGLAEGLQVTKIAQYIKSGKWEFSDRVSRIHLFGMSLGGHAALYSSLYADYVKGDENLFSSVFVGCPVIDFKSSLEHVTDDSVFGKLIRHTLLKQIVDLMRLVPWYDDYFRNNPRLNPNQGQLREMLVGGAFDYYKERTLKSPWNSAPLQKLRFTKEEDFWKWMDYSAKAVPMMKTPVYVWAPENDDIVLFQGNAHKLYASDASLRERRVYKLSTTRGGHCAFPSVFGWATAATIMNSFFIARSPELLKQTTQRTIGLSPGFIERMRLTGKRFRTGLEWSARANDDAVTLTMSWGEVPCSTGPRTGAPRACNGSSQVKIHLDELHISNKIVPKTKVEAQALTRTLNARIRFVQANGKPLSKTGEPAAIRFTSYGKLDDLQ